jgi:hypothetical protein
VNDRPPPSKRPDRSAGRRRASSQPAETERAAHEPTAAHEWLSFADPDEERTWLFDVTFLESPWTCIFGRGCQGVLTEPAAEAGQGCCSYGAHFTGPDDVARVVAAADALPRELWQHRPARAEPGRWAVRQDRGGQWVTRLVGGACIFLNRPGFAGGPGCALHLGALRDGVAPLTRKPDVCWQLPLRREDLRGDDGHVTSVVRQWERRDWGAGGAEFHWWCTEAPEAFVGRAPVYQVLRAELDALVGVRVADQLRDLLSRRQATAAATSPRRGRRVVALPHPARR